MTTETDNVNNIYCAINFTNINNGGFFVIPTLKFQASLHATVGRFKPASFEIIIIYQNFKDIQDSFHQNILASFSSGCYICPFNASLCTCRSLIITLYIFYLK